MRDLKNVRPTANSLLTAGFAMTITDSNRSAVITGTHDYSG
jgi:hypothetical protein